jgi:hypothetical protein
MANERLGNVLADRQEVCVAGSEYLDQCSMHHVVNLDLRVTTGNA